MYSDPRRVECASRDLITIWREDDAANEPRRMKRRAAGKTALTAREKARAQSASRSIKTGEEPLQDLQRWGEFESDPWTSALIRACEAALAIEASQTCLEPPFSAGIFSAIQYWVHRVSDKLSTYRQSRDFEENGRAGALPERQEPRMSNLTVRSPLPVDTEADGSEAGG